MTVPLEREFAQVRDFRDAADWYRRCLEGVIDRTPVRDMDEARVHYDAALDALEPALSVIERHVREGERLKRQVGSYIEDYAEGRLDATLALPAIAREINEFAALPAQEGAEA